MSENIREGLEIEVRRIIGKTFGLSGDELAGDLRMGNPASWDSMGHMQLIMALEGELKWSCPTHQLADLTDIGRIVDAVASSRK